MDCCNKEQNRLDSRAEYEDMQEEEEYDDEQQFVGAVKQYSNRLFRLPSDIINMKVRANQVIQHKTNPWSLYLELEDIGFGTYGKVKKACLLSNPEIIRAIKIISKERLMNGIDEEKLSNEILILKNLDHPNIMKLFEFFDDEEYYYMVTEYCDQNDLYQKMTKVYCMNEIVVKFLMGQIFSAVAYLHSKGVFHGDIKLENIMLYSTSKYSKQRFTMINKQLNKSIDLQNEINNYFKTKQNNQNSIDIIDEMLNYEIKLIDFGCSKIFTRKGERKSGIIGTTMYCSPEVIDDLYDEKCDEWSCGVLMYILLSGEPPFEGDTEEEIFRKIKKCEYNFNKEQFKFVSKNCIDLIKKLLEPKINRRIRAIDALRHPFFTETFNIDTVLTQNKDLSLMGKISEIKKPYSKFHEVVTSYMCSNYISKDEEKKLRAVFRYIDYDRKNYLTKEKIEKRLKENGQLVTEDKIKYILNAFDFDENGMIEYQEYINGLCDKTLLFSENNLKKLFELIDEGNKGYLDSKDIKYFAFQDKMVNDEAFKEYLKQFGMKIDDKLDFDNFMYIIQNNCSLDPKDKYNDNIKEKDNTLLHNDENIYEEDFNDNKDNANNINENGTNEDKVSNKENKGE
jgi:calcium-dependent protein kinase